MRNARAYGVVGAGYGDEGKGLTTDFLAASLPGAIVVRTNGGAQAGHTVVMNDGRRHVFHHLGAGALAGRPTHLSRFFVSNPMLFADEAETLSRKGANVSVTADPRGAVTTPWDVMVNQIVERTRGGGRHGSCGLGFGETVGRMEGGEHALAITDLHGDASMLRQKLEAIRSRWIVGRLAELGVSSISEEDLALINNEAILNRFVEDCLGYAASVRVKDDACLGSGDVVFEGAQGLMLDQDLGAFPHVTRSHTGALNMAAVAREAGFSTIDVTYVTRAYVTRHGAGPLAHEVERLDFADVLDPTNHPNPWQGTIRYAPLDLDVLRNAIESDVARVAGTGIGLRTSLAVTCLDQVHRQARIFEGGVARDVSAATLPEVVASSVGIPLALEAHGPNRAEVERVIPKAA